MCKFIVCCRFEPVAQPDVTPARRAGLSASAAATGHLAQLLCGTAPRRHPRAQSYHT